MSPKKENLCAVIIGNAPTCEKAEEIACRMQNCPYVVLYTASERLVVGVFMIPPGKRWWIEYPGEHPEVLGLEVARIEVMEDMDASNPWIRREVEPVLPVAPCGSDCGQDPLYPDTCRGCPATTYYVGD